MRHRDVPPLLIITDGTKFWVGAECQRVSLLRPTMICRVPLPKGFQSAAVDGFDAEAGGEEEELKLTWEEDVHVELCQVAFIFAGFEIFLVRPGDVLHLFKLVVFARGVKQHGKFVVWNGDFVFEVDVRGTVEGVTEVIDVGEEDVSDETAIGCKVVVGIFEGIELLFNFVEVGKGVEREQDQVELSLINTDYETGLCAVMASSIIQFNF